MDDAPAVLCAEKEGGSMSSFCPINLLLLNLLNASQGASETEG
jgi:hypothetical protein